MNSYIKIKIQHGAKHCNQGIMTPVCEMIYVPKDEGKLPFCMIFGELKKDPGFGMLRHDKCLQEAQPKEIAGFVYCQECRRMDDSEKIYCMSCGKRLSR